MLRILDMHGAKSCSSISCLINTEPLQLLCLQPSEPITSESAEFERCSTCRNASQDSLRFSKLKEALQSLHIKCLQ